LNAGTVTAGFPFTGSAQITGSLGVTGSINSTSITSSLFGTGSWAVSSSRSISASNAVTASYATYAASAGTTTTVGMVAPSGSAGGANQSLNFFAGAGLTAGAPPTLTVNIGALSGKVLGVNAFIGATMTGSAVSAMNNYIVVDNMDVAGNITFASQAPIHFTFTGIYF
jgi:hypothetical protein